MRPTFVAGNILSFEEASGEYRRALLAVRVGLTNAWRALEFRDGSVTWTLFAWRRWQMRDQGWKIHIASSVGDSPRLFNHVVPFLISSRHCFKLPSTLEDILKINSGQAGREVIGKIVTVYPGDDSELPDLITKLDGVWRSHRAPQILTDLRVPGGGSISLRFGSFRSDIIVRDAFGRGYPAVRRPDGVLVPDERRLDGMQPPWVISPIPEAAAAVPQAQYELTICGQRLLLIATLQSTPKGDTFLAADESFQTFIVKTAQCGVGEDARGQDSCERLQREAEILRYLAEKEFRSPRVHAIAPDALVLEDVDGIPLTELPGENIGEAVQKLVSAVANLHDLGVVHRDLKLSNAILSGSDLYLIDFELAALAGGADIPMGGTRGFVPPEGVDVPMSPASDVYSLGACIAHAALGVCPSTLVPGVGRLRALLISSGQKCMADVVATAMNATPALRPTARELERRLSELPVGWPTASKYLGRPQRSDARRIGDRLCRKIVEAAMYSSAGAADLPGRSASSRYPVGLSDDTISSGTAGIVIGLSVIDFTTRRNNFDKRIILASERLARSDRSGPAFGLFTGQAGIAFTLALAGRRYSRNDLLHEGMDRFTFAASHVVEPDLFSGGAGIIWGACILAPILRSKWPIEAAEQAACRLRESVLEHEELLVWPLSGHAVEDAYFGAAHGSAGIAMSLAVWAHFTGRAEFRELAHATFARLYQHGRTPEALQLRYRVNSMEGADCGAWCHGAAGYLWCMLQAFGDHDSLSDPINWAFRTFGEVPLVGNASYCHGMAGQLDLWRLLRRYPRFSQVANERANLAAGLLEHLGFRNDKSWMWSGDEPGQTNPALWTGTLGPACALALFHKGSSEPLFCPELLDRVFRSNRN